MSVDCTTGAGSRRPAQDAMRPGSGNATGNGGGVWRKAQFGQGEIPGEPLVVGRGKDAAQPGAMPPAASPRGTALRSQSSGLPSLDNRSVLKLRPDFCCSADMPQW